MCASGVGDRADKAGRRSVSPTQAARTVRIGSLKNSCKETVVTASSCCEYAVTREDGRFVEVWRVLSRVRVASSQAGGVGSAEMSCVLGGRVSGMWGLRREKRDL